MVSLPFDLFSYFLTFLGTKEQAKLGKQIGKQKLKNARGLTNVILQKLLKFYKNILNILNLKLGQAKWSKQKENHLLKFVLKLFFKKASLKINKIVMTNRIKMELKWLTNMTSSAGSMPIFDKVLKNASLFWGCSVCENAQNSFRKFTWKSGIYQFSN